MIWPPKNPAHCTAGWFSWPLTIVWQSTRADRCSTWILYAFSLKQLPQKLWTDDTVVWVLSMIIFSFPIPIQSELLGFISSMVDFYKCGNTMKAAGSWFSTRQGKRVRDKKNTTNYSLFNWFHTVIWSFNGTGCFMVFEKADGCGGQDEFPVCCFVLHSLLLLLRICTSNQIVIIWPLTSVL